MLCQTRMCLRNPSSFRRAAGWLKNSLAGMTSGAKCDLYIKKANPQPSPPPPSAAPLWPVPVNVSYGANRVNVSAHLSLAVFPPALNASVQAYAEVCILVACP